MTRAVAMGVVALLAVGVSTQFANAATAAPATFQSSFESGDPQVEPSTPYGDPVNVTGKVPPGSLDDQVASVAASEENGPGEAAVRLIDGDPATKWLTHANSGSVEYRFDAPVVMTDYALTTANDAPERDPKDFSVEASNDGSTWTTLDQRTGQVFDTRQKQYAFTTSNTTAFSRYRLVIAANAGGSLTQLADWDVRDSRPGVSPMRAVVGAGPTNGPNNKPGTGFSGSHALRYAGKHVAAGAATATDVLYEGLDLPIASNTELSYKLFDDGTSDLAVPSSFVAMDLVLSDGTTMSSHNDLTDQNGFGVTARAHGQQKAFFENQWNSVKIDLGRLAGRSVDKILLTYDYPTGSADTTFSGWLDDVSIAPGAATIDGSSKVNYVDTRRGTMSSSSLSRGMNIPAAAVPNGFNFFTPMTDGGSTGTLYEYQRANNDANRPTLQAIGISHEPSIWMGDRDQLGVMPATSTDPDASLGARALSFDHTNELARPDLYSVKFDNGLVAEVTPTDHGGIYRFKFPSDSGSVILDRVGGSSSLKIAADGTVSGWTDGGNGSGISRMFISGSFDVAPKQVGDAKGDRSDARYAAFDVPSSGIVQLRIATSFISQAQATHNLDLEVAGKSFAEVNAAATSAWNARLGVIDVQGATDTQRTSLYSSLYRMNLYPNSQFENVGTASAPRYQHASPVAPQQGAATDTTTNAKIVDGKIYVNNGFWDTYRTVWPLYTLLYPKIAAELADGFTQQYREGGWISRWSSPGYSDIMTGTSSDVAFADAYINGALPTKQALDAYDAALKNATVVAPSSNVGRKSLDTSIFLGYTPDSQGESVSWGLEGYINDYGIGKMAAKLSTDPATPEARRPTLAEESKYFLDRATNYVQMFDPSTGFFRPKTASGAVSGGANYDPTAWWGPYTETNGWNFAFHAPFDIDGLEALYGGSDGLVKKLDQFFATPETGGDGTIHEMVEAREVRMGQLGMSNQPSHHIPYLYAAAGAPAKTQAAVREIEQRLFVGSDIGQGYLGDEDNGEMSSWYVFSALGFYPLAVASGQYEIGSPLFAKSTIHLENGKDLVIDAGDNTTATPYVAGVQLNGRAVDTPTLQHDALTAGGTLRFTMSATPTTWGTHAATKPAVRTPNTDVTKAGYGAVSVSDTTSASSLSALTDDTARSATTFVTTTPSVTWSSTSGAVAVNTYTLTSGADGADATAWHLEASSDGTTWKGLDKRSGETFSSRMQTRPFTIAKPGSFTKYRLTIDATSTGKPATVAELELMAQPGTTGTLAVTGRQGVSGSVGTPVTVPLGSVSGGVGHDAGDYSATVDFHDGAAPTAATLQKTGLGTYDVVAPHTFAESGEYPVTVTASDGTSQATAQVTVSITRNGTLAGAFDSVCIGDRGVGADCDTKGWAFDRALLAKSGFVQGTTIAVPGTDLTFDLPQIPAGKPDNATGNGQTIHLALGSETTKLSIVGTGTQAAQHVTGTLTFSDGSTMAVPVDFGDWVGAASNPVNGGIVVGSSAGRLSGSNSSDGQTAAVFATAPITLPPGKTVASLTLPKQAGDAGSTGRIHVFAVATNGTRTTPTPLTATAVPVARQKAGASFTAPLAIVSGGSSTDYTARVNWGDGSPLTDGAVAGGTVSGTHEYGAAGTYTVSVTADDGVSSSTTTTTVIVTAPPAPAVDPLTGSVAPGATVTVHGHGFPAGAQVEVALSTDPEVTATATADANGDLQVDVVVPTGTADGTYALTAAAGTVTATSSLVIHAATVVVPKNAELRLSTGTVVQGGTVRAYGDGFPADSDVVLALHSTPVQLGIARTNADGMFVTDVQIPATSAPGLHQIEASVGSVTTSADLMVTDTVATVGTTGADPGRGQQAGAAAHPWQGLAYTGTDGASLARLGWLAAAMLALGALLTVLSVRRRRRSRSEV